MNQYNNYTKKYRPIKFDIFFVGQEEIVKSLINSFELNIITQAYLFSGNKGTGKTTIARILARGLNYETDKIKYSTLNMNKIGIHCNAIINGKHIDVIEINAASHTGINNIRELILESSFKPLLARYKIFIIDEIHMLSKQAFNGLLKTLEEPPLLVKFILITTELNKIPTTILSRCQRYQLSNISKINLIRYFKLILNKEKIKYNQESLKLLSEYSEGSVRDGLIKLEQNIYISNNCLTLKFKNNTFKIYIKELIFAILFKNYIIILNLLNLLKNSGCSIELIIEELLTEINKIIKTKLNIFNKRNNYNFNKNYNINTFFHLWDFLLRIYQELKVLKKLSFSYKILTIFLFKACLSINE